MAEEPRNPQEIGRQWLSEIQAAIRYGKIAEWQKRGDQIIRRFKDERDDQRDGLTFRRHRMNVLWSNIETITPALYARTPKPEVQRRNKDKDGPGRWASVVLERCLAYVLGFQEFNHTMRECVSDYLLPGRGVTWETYEPTFAKDAQGADKLDWETTRTKYIHWKDFLTNPARTWDEVWWCAHRAFLGRDEVKALLQSLGVENAGQIANDIELDHRPEGMPKPTVGDDRNAKATIWCIWDKNNKEVVYVSPGYTDGALSLGPPPLRLDGFFPCPRPLTTTTATDTIIPTPDFCQYQDQADEIDELTQRIYLLSRALKVVGLYNTAVQSLGQLLNDATDNTMIPVDQWAMFAEKGGLKGAVDFFPMDVVAATLEKCIATREVAKQAMYEITGISDIVRGASDANETATAQQIKSQWGSLRIRDRQQEVQRFARDIVRIKAEIICETFSDDTIKQMSGVKLMTQAEKQMAQQMAQQAPEQAQAIAAQKPELAQLVNEPTWEEVLGLLRNERVRGFVIDIETDSTIEPDANTEQQKATELLTAVGGYFTAVAPIVQQMPALAPLIGELLLFGVRRFKIGETIEGTIETAMAAVQQQLAGPKPPDPAIEIEQQKAQAEAQRSQAELQLKDKEITGNLSLKEKEIQGRMQLAAVESQAKQQQAQADLQAKRDMADGQNRMKMEMEGMRMDHMTMNEGVTGQTGKMINGAVQELGGTFQAGMEALAQGIAELAKSNAAQAQSFQAGMGQLAQAVMAETELVRDGQGRAAGTRRKMPMVQ